MLPSRESQQRIVYLVWAALAWNTFGSCAMGDLGNNDANTLDRSSVMDASGNDTTTDGLSVTDGATDSNNRPDVPPIMDDAFPVGAVGFFRAMQCPSGWVSFANANGFTVIHTPAGGTHGGASGTALMDMEDRTHTHMIPRSTVSFPAVSYAGLPGGGNASLTDSGNVTYQTNLQSGSANIPYIQLLVCRRAMAPLGDPASVPTGIHQFFATTTCPSGWSVAPDTNGRVIVPMGVGSSIGATRGGTPLTNREVRTHTHTYSLMLNVPSHGIALLSGGAAADYAAAGTRTIAGSMSEDAVNFPYLQLLQCVKN